MTREEFREVVVTVAPALQVQPQQLDTIMRAADAYAYASATHAAKTAAEFFGFPPVNLEEFTR